MSETKYTIDDLKSLYKKYQKEHGKEAYRYLSELLREAKPLHKKCFSGKDHEQSWRAFKGKNLEKLIEHIIKAEVESLGLRILNGNVLERTLQSNLSAELGQVKVNLMIDFGKHGSHLPDADLIIYHPDTYKVVAILSSKVTLRERISQTGYWKFKLLSQPLTKHIKVYFISPDEDGTLTRIGDFNKGRAIVEADLDGSYVLSEVDIEESNRVKMFDKFIGDLKKVLEES